MTGPARGFSLPSAAVLTGPNKAGNIYYEELPAEVKDNLWQMFFDAIAPLKSAGKLGYLLLQLPPWGTKNRENLRHVEEFLDRTDGYSRPRVQERYVAVGTEQGEHAFHASRMGRADGDRRRAGRFWQQHAGCL